MVLVLPHGALIFEEKGSYLSKSVFENSFMLLSSGFTCFPFALN